ncbi:MAG: peroxiredoxin family protein [Pseudomonadota bacterium]|nr:peroxiredoxin family protein [Pseudomonadota bacterium]
MSALRPASGEPFPSFSFETLANGRIAFDTLPGWRLLVVYRGRHCPICKTYLKGLDGLLGEFADAGIAVYAVSADPKERAEAEAAQEGWRFPVGHDFVMADMQRLGVYISKPRSPEETDRPFAEPAVFVVNPEGRLQVVDISNAPFARPDLAGLLRGLKFVQAKNYPPRGTA